MRLSIKYTAIVMRTIVYFALLTLILLSACHKEAMENTAQHPFPQNITYQATYLQPSITVDQLNNSVISLYDQWKEKYIKQCDSRTYYVDFTDEDPQTATVSEAMGYGMMITAYMAGADPQAKQIFDGLLQFYLDHPSNICPQFMAWRQGTDCQNTGFDAATDGDEDVAFALLLANAQWGSSGKFNYLDLARKIIAALKQCAFSDDAYPLLGDWVKDASDTAYTTATRSSDWMPDHYLAFYHCTQDTFWLNATKEVTHIARLIQQNFSPETGLLPDFVIHTSTSPRPAYPGFLETPYDGQFYYNACRTPWRLTAGYLMTGDTALHTIINKINTWIIHKTAGDPQKIMAGYTLDGSAVSDYNDIAFTGSLAVSAMAGTDSQWLDACLEQLLDPSTSDYTYYGNTLRLLYLLVISGNYWLP